METNNFPCFRLAVLAILLGSLLAQIAAAEAPSCTLDPVTDEVLVGSTKEIVALISTYRPEQAREQFERAKARLEEPALKEFSEDMQGTELKAIDETKRTQTFTADDAHIKVERFPDLGVAVVRLPGKRQKIIGVRPLPADDVIYYLKYRAFCAAGAAAVPKVVDIRLRRAPLEADESPARTLPARRRIPADTISTPESRRGLANEAYGDLIQAFKNDIDRLSRENAELVKEVTELKAKVQTLDHDIAELKKR